MAFRLRKSFKSEKNGPFNGVNVNLLITNQHKDDDWKVVILNPEKYKKENLVEDNEVNKEERIP